MLELEPGQRLSPNSQARSLGLHLFVAFDKEHTQNIRLMSELIKYKHGSYRVFLSSH